MRLPPACLQAMQAHALRDYPRESCGVIVDGDYLPLENRAADPHRDFAIADDEYRRLSGRIQAVVHSHPNGPLHPSRADMEGQVATDVPWIIVPTDGNACAPPIQWGDEAETPDPVGREFRHGVTDCYALVRDHYRLAHGIRLPEVPRDDEWWNQGGNLYLEHFERAGFRRIELAELRVGDAVLMQVRSPVPNHAAVLVEPDLILHHLQSRLSRREPLGPWLRFVTHALRHRDIPPPPGPEETA